ncbi:MAG: hypothetical protein ABSF64_27820 [Bryobacteraceae bacterium]
MKKACTNGAIGPAPLFRNHLRAGRNAEHFKPQGPVIQPLTTVGAVTARMLRLNAAERVIERRLMQALGLYRKV